MAVGNGRHSNLLYVVDEGGGPIRECRISCAKHSGMICGSECVDSLALFVHIAVKLRPLAESVCFLLIIDARRMCMRITAVCLSLL